MREDVESPESVPRHDTDQCNVRWIGAKACLRTTAVRQTREHYAIEPMQSSSRAKLPGSEVSVEEHAWPRYRATRRPSSGDQIRIGGDETPAADVQTPQVMVDPCASRSKKPA